MKKKATKKQPELKEVPQQRSHFMELRFQAVALSDFGSIGWGQGRMQDVLEEIVKAMTPLQHFKEASIEYSEDVDQTVVIGYLSLFLDQIDHILGHAELVLKTLNKERTKPPNPHHPLRKEHSHERGLQTYS